MSGKKSPGTVCAGWWWHAFSADDGAARMTRARFRRCTTPAEALTVEATHDLNGRLRSAGYHPRADRLALVAIVLARVTEDGRPRLATVFGRRESRNSPRALSEMRFQNLIQTTTQADLIRPLRRAMSIVRRTPVNVSALGNDLYHWNEGTRTAWCFQYFGATDAAPKQISLEIDS